MPQATQTEYRPKSSQQPGEYAQNQGQTVRNTAKTLHKGWLLTEKKVVRICLFCKTSQVDNYHRAMKTPCESGKRHTADY